MKNIVKYSLFVAIAALTSGIPLIGAEKRAMQMEFLELRALPQRTPEQQARYDELRDLVAPNLKFKEQALVKGHLMNEKKDLQAIENRTAKQQQRLNFLEKALADQK